MNTTGGQLAVGSWTGKAAWMLAFSATLQLCNPAILAAQADSTPWLDSRLPPERRAALLVARLTLEEKVSQTGGQAAAIPRVGVPDYGWWNEALHGVARAGLATSFPQAIGFAATWDDALILRMATAISDEARAKHQD